MKETAGSAWPILLYGVSAIVLLALAAPTDLSASSKASDGEQQRIDSPIGNPEDAANVLDDLCRFHGDQVVRPSSVVPSSADHRSGGGGHSASIDVVHEIFDPTFGLAPYISYTVRVGRGDGMVEKGYVYALQATTQGTVTGVYASSSRLCNVGAGTDSSIHLVVLLPSIPANFTWMINSTPEALTNITLRLVGYQLHSRKLVNLAEAHHTLLPGCYLKFLDSTHGMMTNLHFNNPLEHLASWGCSVLLRVPQGSNAELSLRKLRLPRLHSHECHEENQLQWASSASLSPEQPPWSALVEPSQWLVARNFCGKIQDYSRNTRIWRTSDPWVRIYFRAGQRTRYSQEHTGGNGFFAFKFNMRVPCSNLLLTERSKTMDLFDWELAPSAPECTFRIHLPYGYRIQLSATLLINGKGPSSRQENGTDMEISGNINVWPLDSGKCLISVHTEDVAGRKIQCLNEQHSTITVSSLTNVLSFQAIMLHGNEQNKNSSSDRNRLQVGYTSVEDPSLVRGCSEGVAADETSCIWLNPESLSWQEAEMQCRQSAPGGHLVAITDASIQQVVDAVITNSANFEPTRSFWIGASDQKQETKFQWSNGEPVNFAKWFPGWPTYQNYNSQPSDDGLSNQDCVEVRQTFSQPGLNDMLANGLYWNDRDCTVPNPFVCQKPKSLESGSPVSKFQTSPACNRSEELTRYRTSTVMQSPSFPRPYPTSVSCTVDLTVPQGFKIVLNFHHFDLEDEEDCNYDSLEVRDLAVEEGASDGKGSTSWKRCGDWNSRLKLLRWRSTGNRIRIHFSSDATYGGGGFQFVATMERSDFICPEVGSIGSIVHQGHCYLIVPFPEMGWNAASLACKTIQAELVLPDSGDEELRFLSDQLHADLHLNATEIYWIGQASRFQLSIPQSADTIQHCPALRTWHTYSNTSLEPCHSSGGYICERTAKSNFGVTRNSSIESREGEVKSPNYPGPYNEVNHFRLHIKAPNASSTAERIVMRFKQIDIEFQENCLYDYIGLQSRENGPMQKICGQYNTNLDRLDYISDTSEMWLTFHSDYSVSGNGFHAIWSTMHLTGCPQRVLDQPTGELFSPNFPRHYLPHLNCTTHLIAPEGFRISIKFHVFEVGFQKSTRLQQMPCRDEYVQLAWDDLSVTLCGSYNQTRDMQWISYGNKMSVQLVSNGGKQGRGFHASYRFESVGGIKKDIVELSPIDRMEVIPLNFPHPLPETLRYRVTFVTHHGFYLRFDAAAWLEHCDDGNLPSSLRSSAVVLLSDVYNNGTEIELCGNQFDEMDLGFESIFHTLTIEYQQVNGNKRMPILGTMTSIADASYTEKLSIWPEDSLAVDSCDLKPCQNGGSCITDGDQNYCKCIGNWRGIFCSLTLCQVPTSCHHGSCLSINGTQRCNCDPGFTGSFCETRLSACDLEPCGDRGKCVPNGEDFICQCHAWWKGPRCEQRWLHLPYKPLSQRMLEEPFWLGLMTISIVLIIILIVWCVKRHFAEKIDRFVTEELERGKLVEPALLDWNRGKHGSTSGQRLSIEVSGTSRPASPLTGLNVPETASQRHFLGWTGFRKPSLLSITSLISPSHSHTNVPGPPGPNGGGNAEARSSSGQREGRTFSLDDLFRLPKRSPSPSKRASDNDVASQQRETERQQILQRLISSQIPGQGRSNKPGQAVMMTSMGGRNSLTVDDQSTDTEFMETAVASQLQLQLDLKAEKKVTFARMMEMVKADVSSSETDTSAGEELNKSREMAIKVLASDQRNSVVKRKHRSWNSRRFWRAQNSNSSTQGSASDHETPENPSLTDSMMAQSESFSGRKGNRHLRLPCRTASASGRQASSTESLLSIIRNFSSTNHRTPSTPSSPKSDYDISSSFPTPLSTPGSPAGSLEALALTPHVTDSTTTIIQVPVIDTAQAQRTNRTAGATLNTPHITLEIPSTNYGQFLSPIHEVPTPLPSPSHTPVPTLRRQGGISDSSSLSNDSPPCKRLIPQIQLNKTDNISSDESRKSSSSVSTPPTVLDKGDGNQQPAGGEQRRSITIVVPAIQIVVESDSPSPSPLSSPSPSRTKPPPLHILNSNFARFEAFNKMNMEEPGLACESRPQPPRTLPVFCISEPSPDSDSQDLEKHHDDLTDEKKSLTQTVMNWEHVSIGSPPVRKHPVDMTISPIQQPDNQTAKEVPRRVLKESVSSSLDLTNPPPMITVTANFSEVESDSDAGTLGRGGMLNNQSKMCYLSPFACYGAVRPEMAASESNLSSSGYSSMASPGPASPSSSSKNLHSCILEEGMGGYALYSRKSNRASKDRPRIVLSPSFESSTDDQAVGPIEPVEHESTVEYESNDEAGDFFPFNEKIENGELKSAKELEDFLTNVQMLDKECITDKKMDSFARVQKSKSLDSKLVGQRKNNFKSGSLDTKISSIQPSGGPVIILQSLQLPEPQSASFISDSGGTLEESSKKSPVSSRSESPVSDAKSAGLGRFSTQFYGKSRTDLPYTDSDGLYDYPSSETVPPAFSAPRRHARKCDRRRERKSSLKSIRLDHHDNLDGGAKRSLLDPFVDRGTSSRQPGSKRRIRAHTNADLITSSSNESLTTESRGSRRRSPRLRSMKRGSLSSPVCEVILTIQAASSPDQSVSEASGAKPELQPAPDLIEDSQSNRVYKLPTSRSRPLNQTARRRHDSGGPKRREQSLSNLRNPRRRPSLPADGATVPRDVDNSSSSSSSCDVESEFCDSNESLANLAEIEDSTDTPPGEGQHKSVSKIKCNAMPE